MNTKLKQDPQQITFIGGGNMASALIKGLISDGRLPEHIFVVEPAAEARARLKQEFSVRCISDPTKEHSWQTSSLIVWAVKPQQMKLACDSLASLCHGALHLSVAAGIPTSSLTQWLKSERVVRAMPNTPALIGLGQTGLFSRHAVNLIDRKLIESIIKGTGEFIWLPNEQLLDSVTAVSGSGPAYVFYFLEALAQAAAELGLGPDESKQLAIGTFIGASHLALQSNETLSALRERVTSKGGTTEAALNHMNDSRLAQSFKDAVKRAAEKSFELGVNYGK